LHSCEQALSEDSIVGPRASVFLPGKDGDLSGIALATTEAGDIEHIVDAAGRRPGEKQAARSQIEFADTA